MRRRGLLLDIYGLNYALVSHDNIVPTFATNKLTVIAAVPPGVTSSVDIDTFDSDAGGTTLRLTDASPIIQHRTSEPRAVLAESISDSDTSLEFDDISGFPSSGTLWVGGEAIEYSTPVANSVTLDTRGALQTNASSHIAGAIIYGNNPSLIGRRCDLYWVDLDDVGQKTLRFQGFVDSVSFTSSGYEMPLISVKKLVTDNYGLSRDFAKGKLASPLEAGKRGRIEIDLENPDVPFSDNRGSAYDRGYLRVGDELIQYPRVFYPKLSGTVDSVISARVANVLHSTESYRIGESVEILDNLGAFKAIGKVLEKSPISGGTQLSIESDDSWSFAIGDEVNTHATAVIPYGLVRGAEGTEDADHEVGDEVNEYRVLKGDQIDILLQLLFSDEGTGANGPSGGIYDVLPEGWGLGIKDDIVDLENLQKLQASGRSTSRRYRLNEKFDLQTFIANIGKVTNSLPVWGEDGKLRFIELEDIYPEATTTHVIDKTLLRAGVVPSVTFSEQRIKNSWEFRSDYSLDGEHRRVHTIAIADSVGLHGERSFEPLEDQGLVTSQATAQIFTSALANLDYRARPLAELTVDVRFQESVTYRPGQAALVDIPHLPNSQGGKGINNVFLITEVSPSDPEGYITLNLIEFGELQNVGLVAPAAVVENAVGTTINLEEGSVSGLAPDGQDDVEFFTAGDPVTFYDDSSLGTASFNIFNTTISSVNVGLDQVVVAAVPSIGVEGWEIAAGDIMTLGDYQTTKDTSPNADDRVGVYVAIADDSTPPNIGTDDDPANIWGK